MAHRKKAIVALIVIAALVVVVLLLTRSVSGGPIDLSSPGDRPVGAIDRTPETP